MEYEFAQMDPRLSKKSNGREKLKIRKSGLPCSVCSEIWKGGAPDYRGTLAHIACTMNLLFLFNLQPTQLNKDSSRIVILYSPKGACRWTFSPDERGDQINGGAISLLPALILHLALLWSSGVLYHGTRQQVGELGDPHSSLKSRIRLSCSIAWDDLLTTGH